MPRSTFTAILRSHFGSGRRNTPGAIGGHIHLRVDCGLTTKQIVGRLARNVRINEVRVLGNPADGGTQPSAGTFQMDLEATAAPLPVLALANVVAAGGTLSAVGTKTVVAASLLLAFNASRDISVTVTGGTAGQVAWIGVTVIPHDDGKELN